MRISLKVNVEDVAGYQNGLPALLHLFEQYKIKATFLFSLGYDNTGLGIKNLFSPRILSKQLPFKQKLLGTFLPPVALSKKYRLLMKQCLDAGHEVGMSSYDSIDWRFHALDADYDWTKRCLEWSIESFEDILGMKPTIHSASGFVINEHLLALEEKWGFNLALDTLGKTAFFPEYRQTLSNVLQLPVTLPSFESLMLKPDIALDNVHEYLFVESQIQLPHGHVFDVRAAYEGCAWLPLLEKMIVMWKSSQWEFYTVSELIADLKKDEIQRHQIGWAQYKPDSRFMATQGLPLSIE